MCVYCGSRTGLDPAQAKAAREVGEEIGRRGWQLVYGGGKAGLMGVVADAVLEHGGRVVGVIPRILMEREVGHRGLNELHVVETMHQRKQMMAERARAFLALPGGIGTLEELFEVWTWGQLGLHAKPLGLLDVAGYFERLHAFLDHMAAEGFVKTRHRAMAAVHYDPATLLDLLESYQPPETIRVIDRETA